MGRSTPVFVARLLVVLATLSSLAACRTLPSKLTGSDAQADVNSDLFKFIHKNPRTEVRSVFQDANTQQLITFEYGPTAPVLAAVGALADKFAKPVQDLQAQRAALLADDTTAQQIAQIYDTLKLDKDIVWYLPEAANSPRRAQIKAVVQSIVAGTVSADDVKTLKQAFVNYISDFKSAQPDDTYTKWIKAFSEELAWGLFNWDNGKSYLPLPAEAALVTQVLGIVDFGLIYRRVLKASKSDYLKFSVLADALRIKMIFYALQRQPDPAASSYLFSRLKGRGERLKIDLLSEKDFDLPTTITLRAYTMDRATQAVSFEEFCLSLYNDYAKGITEKGRQSYIQASLPTAVGDAAMPPSVAWELPIKQKNIISSFIWWLKSGGSSANAASPANVRAGLQSFYDYLDLLSNQNDLYKPLKDYILNANKMIGEGTLAVSPTRFEVPAPAALAADSAADAGRSAPTPTPGDDAQDDTPDASSDQNGSEPTSTPDSRPGDGKGR